MPSNVSLRILALLLLSSVVVTGCSPSAQAPAAQPTVTSAGVTPTTVPAPTPTVPPTSTAVPTAAPTVPPPPPFDEWAQETAPDTTTLAAVVAVCARAMGLQPGSIQTAVEIHQGVNGPFALIVDSATRAPLLIAVENSSEARGWKLATLDNVAQQRGMRFGAMLNLNRDFHDITVANFGTGNAFVYWDIVQAEKGKWDFSDPDYNIKTARREGIDVLSGLLWAKSLPDWAKQDPDLHGAMTEYITQVMGHYQGQVRRWIVYNEATLHGTDDVFWNELGGIEAVRDAFKLARATDPKAELLYNDYVDLDGTSTRDRWPTFESVVSQIDKDGNLDGIGLQVVAREESFDAAKLRQVLDALSKYGLPIHITEFSILINGDNTPANMAEQARAAAEVMRILREYPQVVEVIAFPLEDRIANQIYLPDSNSGLWLKTDSGYVPKPAVFEMMKALAEEP